MRQANDEQVFRSVSVIKTLFANGPLLGHLCTPLSANGPLLGHLFGFKYIDEITLMYILKLL